MNVRFPTRNRYLPKDTYQIISEQIFKSDYNFFFLFNFPDIVVTDLPEKILPEKIRINEEIERFRWASDFLESIRERRESLINLFRNSGFNVENFVSRCSWRLIIGLGGIHPQETSMTLHHIYGIPYIPGSAIKGVTRHWAVLKFAEQMGGNIREVSNALESGVGLSHRVGDVEFSDLVEIFGTQKKIGKVIFMDAYPVEGINLKIDIINPHYPEYYSGNQPPADWQNPNPIKFLTVEKTQFQFYLVSRDVSLLRKSVELLREALKSFGVGAKTSLGYGIFEI